MARNPADDQDRGDKLGDYPKNYDMPALSDRRSQFVNWYLAVAFGLSMLLNVALAAAIVMMMPLKSIEPILVQFAERSETFARVIPRDAMTGMETLTESLVRQYVTYRHTILPNLDEMAGRWGANSFMFYAASPEVYGAFAAQGKSALERLAQQNARIARNIKVENATRSPNAPNVWFVDFTVSDTDAVSGQPLNSEQWIATISYEFSSDLRARIPYQDRLVNPTGFRVNAYSLSRK
jgi:type IV secretory pathway component VirB8